MSIQTKDWLLLVLGAALSVPMSIISTLILIPLQSATWSYWLIEKGSKTFPFGAPSHLRERDWRLLWEVKSANFPAKNPSPMTLYCFCSAVAAEWSATSSTGEKKIYRMVGLITSQRMITARWYDAEANVGYIGALQLVFSPLNTFASGKWIGFSSDQTVKSGEISIEHFPRRLARGGFSRFPV